MEGTAPVARSAPSLQDLIVKVRMHEIIRRVDQENRIFRLAAQRASESPASFPVEVEGWNRVIWIDPETGEPEPDLDPHPEEVKERARAVAKTFREHTRCIAKGMCVVRWAWLDGQDNVGSLLAQTEFHAIAEQYDAAKQIINAENPQPPLWVFLAEWIITHSQVPGVNLATLAEYADARIVCGGTVQSTPVSAAVARLNDSGQGERLLAELVERFEDALPAEVLITATDAPRAAEAEQPADDDYVLASELWPDRSEFKRPADVTKFFNAIPNEPAPVGIRNRRKGQRRYVHEADWHRHFREKDRAASELLDDEALQEKLADIEAAKADQRRNRRK